MRSFFKKKKKIQKKSHTCEEGGAHLRISFWPFTDEPEKQIIKKTVEVANKKQNNFNIYNVVFF